MTTEPRAFDLDGSAFDGDRRLMNLVSVEFETSFQKFDCDARELQLEPADRVIVETSRGPAIATVRSWARRAVVESSDVERVLRRATAQDEEQVVRNRASEADAYRFAIERIKTRKLQMKLVRAYWMVDGSKVVFYFSADGRVDFRDLVKDLAHRFRTRIEMHQIGVRDGTRMLGGIGSCGRELCCSTFLQNFAPVSIRMAKDQGLTLNPVRVSGMCGRLMCCLVYEQQLYRSMKKRLPRAKTAVRSRFGPGTVVDVDVINRRVNVEFDDGSRKLLPVSEVVTEVDDSDGFVAPGPGTPNYEWDDEFGPSERAAEPDAAPKRNRRRRRRSGKSKNTRGDSGGGSGQKRTSQKGKGGGPGSNKPKPKSDRSKPKSDGSKPKSDGSKPKSDGSKPKSDGSKPKPKSDNAKSDNAKSEGPKPKSDGSKSKRTNRRSRRKPKPKSDPKD